MLVRMFLTFIVTAWLAAAPAVAQDVPAIAPTMSFFVTSTGRGFGGNLGGLAGADALCRQRAAAVGRGDRLWRAYLSAPPSADAPAIHARDRKTAFDKTTCHLREIRLLMEKSLL